MLGLSGVSHRQTDRQDVRGGRDERKRRVLDRPDAVARPRQLASRYIDAVSNQPFAPALTTPQGPFTLAVPSPASATYRKLRPVVIRRPSLIMM